MSVTSEHVVSLPVSWTTTFRELQTFVALGEMLKISPDQRVFQYVERHCCGTEYTIYESVKIASPVALDLSQSLSE